MGMNEHPADLAGPAPALADLAFNVDPAGLLAVSHFMAKADIRYYLNGICLRPHPVKGVMLIATDGHSLAAFYDREGYATRESILRVHPDMAKNLAAVQRHAIPYRFATVAGRPTLVAGANPADRCDDARLEHWVMPRFEGFEVEGKFPKTEPLFRKAGAAHESGIGLAGMVKVQFLERLGKAQRALVRRDDFHGWKFTQIDGDGTIFCFGSAHDDFMALIMPMRSDLSTKPRDWVTEACA